MYLPDGNKIKGSPIVCWAHHVFTTFFTYFHCNALKAALIWQTERGKALSRVRVVCEERHHPVRTGHSRECRSNTAAKTPLILYHLATCDIDSYLQATTNFTDLS